MVGAVATVLEIFILLADRSDVRHRCHTMHHNPFVPLIPQRVPKFSGAWRGVSVGNLAVFGLRADVQCRGRSGESAEELTRGTGLVVPLSIATYFLPTLLALPRWETGKTWKLVISQKLPD